jgi:hypothetical protein
MEKVGLPYVKPRVKCACILLRKWMLVRGVYDVRVL